MGKTSRAVFGTVNFDIVMVHYLEEVKSGTSFPLGATQALSLIKFDAPGLETSSE